MRTILPMTPRAFLVPLWNGLVWTGLVWTGLAWIAFLWTGFVAIAPARGQGYAPPHPAVARIVATEKDGQSCGSGTLVDARDRFGLVVTNWHVVRDATGPIEVIFPSGFHSFARPLKIDHEWDLAALVIWNPAIEPVAIAAQPPRPGDPLTIAGFGPGIYRAAAGRCTKYMAPSTSSPQEMVEVSVQARQGDSGGPIFNERGELAGVLFGASQGTTLGSYAGRVRGFLASVAPDLAIPDRPMLAQAGLVPQTTGMAGIAPLPETTTATPPALADAEAQVVEPHRQESAIAQVPEPSPGTRALVPIAPARPVYATVPDDRRGPLPATVAIAPHSPATTSTDQVGPLSWRDLTGETPLEQAKTALAAFGAITILIVVNRLMKS